MSVMKQLLLCLVVLAVAFVVWARFFPGAPDTLARLGLDWVPFAGAATNEGGTAGGDGEGQGGQSGFARSSGGVVTAPILNATINDRLSAIGTGRARSSVVVAPFGSGRLTGILVEAGDEIEAGEVIAKLESASEEIAVDRAKLALDDARARLKRIEALRASNTVTAVQVTEAELALRTAELALREAELDLERRSVHAPISGVVGILPVSAGERVTAETAIATIDDRSEILVDFWAPERYADAIAVGIPVVATSIARPDEVFEGAVSAVDNRVDAESRTLRVQARITNPAGTLRAGMAFQVVMRFPGDTYPAVDPLAIQWGADGAYVWAVQNGRARQTRVRIVQRNTDSVLVDGAFKDGDVVVTEGVHTVRDGAEVMIAGQDDSAATGDPAAAGRGS